MEPRRFDALARGLASSSSRRGALRRVAAAAVAALLGRAAVRPEGVNANHCTFAGCGCSGGTRHACASGLVCCASSPGTPGGAGVCSDPGDCPATCTGLGCACASGTFQPCDFGLVCCSSYPGLAGAQGSCQYGC